MRNFEIFLILVHRLLGLLDIICYVALFLYGIIYNVVYYVLMWHTMV